MCGIVGAVSRVDVAPFLLKGLHRLEYRGYDSAGVVVINDAGGFDRSRAVGKVEMLERPCRREISPAQQDLLTHAGRLTVPLPNQTHTHTFAKTRWRWSVTA